MNRTLNNRLKALEGAREGSAPGMLSPGVPADLSLSVLMGEGERYRTTWPQAVAEAEQFGRLMLMGRRPAPEM